MTGEPSGDPESYGIAFEEARRMLDHQAGAIDELRGRAGTLLAAASIAASFLGGVALQDGTIGTSGAVAIVFFAVTVILALYILFPYRDWRFVHGPKTLIEHWIEGSSPVSGPAQLRRELALQIDKNYTKNQEVLDRRWKCYGWGLALVFGMILAWLAELVGITYPLVTK